MRKNIAVQQVLEHPLYQVTNERYFTGMDSISSKHPHNKLCSKCGKNPQMGKGYSFPSWCRLCHNAYKRTYAKNHYTAEKGRDRYLSKVYGFSLEEYNLMLFQQGGVCAICKQPETLINGKTKCVQPLAVDHNHETGEVRELLCNTCNYLVGYVDLDRERVKNVLKYLKKHDS